MKKRIFPVLMLSVIFMLFTFVNANAHHKLNPELQKCLSECSNVGLTNLETHKLDAATASKLIMPLIRFLDNRAYDENDRIIAAQILYDIGDLRGIRMIRDISHFEKESNLKRICSIIYHRFISNKTDELLTANN